MTNEAPLGVLEVLPGGSGFIRRRDGSYTPGKDDIYVGARVIQKFDLRTGDELLGDVGKKPKNGKSPPLRHLSLVNGIAPEDLDQVILRCLAKSPEDRYSSAAELAEALTACRDADRWTRVQAAQWWLRYAEETEIPT